MKKRGIYLSVVLYSLPVRTQSTDTSANTALGLILDGLHEVQDLAVKLSLVATVFPLRPRGPRVQRNDFEKRRTHPHGRIGPVR